MADKLPITIPDRPFPMEPLVFAAQLRQRDPSALDDPADGLVVYHELLQKALVDWIASRHFAAWRIELLRFQLRGTHERWQPVPDAAQQPSTVLSSDELQKRLGRNRFADLHTGFGTLVLPPGTALTITAPKAPENDGEIRLRNRFCDMVIHTSPAMSHSGLGGYALLLRNIVRPEAERHYWTQQYIVRMRVTFSWQWVGHPQMGSHKQWARNIVDGLQNAYDEQLLWRQTVETYMLRQHLPPSDHDLPLPFGPVQATSPPSAAQPHADESKK